MIAKHTVWAMATLLFVSHSAAPARGQIDVTVIPSLARAPADVVISAVVDPDAANRGLVIAAESATFYRASTIQIDGDKGQRSYRVTFHHLPEGDYSVTAVLLGARGEERASSARSLGVF